LHVLEIDYISVAEEVGMTRQLLLIACTLILCFDIAATQTIALKDRHNFVAKFALRDSMDILSVDPSRILEWHLDSTGEWIRLITTISHGSYVWTLLTDISLPRLDSSGYQYWATAGLVSRDVGIACFFLSWYDVAPHMLSTWDLVGSDSLRFRCAFEDDFGHLRDSVWVNNILRLPDSSSLIYVRRAGFDNMTEEGRDWFYRLGRSNEVTPLHKTEWWVERGKKTTYYTEMLPMFYQVVETDIYLSWVERQCCRIDSATGKVIDLWQLAKDKCKIDTTRIGHNETTGFK
jgi:hypothetical protein